MIELKEGDIYLGSVFEGHISQGSLFWNRTTELTVGMGCNMIERDIL